ncbi:MAG: riboflavin biosynthesis protein RibF [Planctomycetota bacterium]
MRTSTTIDGLEPAPEGAVISIGVFDGVHLGHVAILTANVRRARALGAEPTVVTFQGHPKQLLLGRAPRTLTTLGHRLALFERAGIEHAVALPFDDELRRLSSDEFVQRVCVEGLGVHHFVLGFDSKFGRDRTGTPETLTAAGLAVEVVPKVAVAGRAVSSTAIREAMLGRPVSVFGQVVRGRELGRTLGFPTANLDLQHELSPPVGVYATRAHVLDEPGAGPYASVTNVGFRPSVEAPTSASEAGSPLVEVHLFDFDGDLYGRRLELEFLARLREERRFPSLDALEEQIRADARQARELLAKRGTPTGPHG